MRKKILMVCYGGGHVKIMECLYNCLSSYFDITVLALTSAKPYLIKKGIPCLSISDFPSLISSDARVLGKKLTHGMGFSDLDESIAYMGVNYQELINSYGSVGAEKKYKTEGRGCFFPVDFTSGVIDLIKPDLVVATNAPRTERAALFSAKKKSIPSVCISDNLWLIGGVLDVAKEDLATAVCVISEEVKKELIELTSYPGNRIYVTGSPVLDRLKRKRGEWIANAKERTKVNILFADAPLPSSLKAFPNAMSSPKTMQNARQALNYLGQRDGFNVIFRAHPNQKVDYSEFKNVEVSSSDEDLHSLLLNIDILVTAVSTVGLEAYLLGARLITLENTIYQGIVSYESLGMSSGVNITDKLIEVIDTVITEPNLSTDSQVYDGLATENIKNLFQLLLN